MMPFLKKVQEKLKRKNSMSQRQSLSLFEAVFININIMLGTGIFINTVVLAKHTGALGGFLYPIAGIVMLPIILCITKLMHQQPQGDFYSLGKVMNTFWGFVSSWSYFIGKLASVTISIHVFSMFLKHIFPQLPLSLLLIDCLIISIFVLLSTLNVKTGSKIQTGFVFMKMMPLFFVLFCGLWYSQLITIEPASFIWAGLPLSLPLILFCFLGFEASCSLSRIIENPQKNAPRAILISFSIMVTLSTLYQLSFFSILGTALSSQKNYTDAFPLLINYTTPQFFTFLNSLFSVAIATSALGGAYGILYSNMWNLYILAEHKHVPFWQQFTFINCHAIPVWCAVFEGVVCIGYLLIFQGAQIPLQYTATLGCITAYTITTFSYFYVKKSLLGALGIAACIFLLKICLAGFITTSIVPLFVLGTIITIGLVLFLTKTRLTNFQSH
jgi:amino acid transporter